MVKGVGVRGPIIPDKGDLDLIRHDSTFPHIPFETARAYSAQINAAISD